MRLYHFVSPEHGLDDLKKKRVKISLINKLNDPFELQAGFTKPNEEIRNDFSKFKSKVSKDVGIFCCSKRWHNPLLWSHYAARHTGIALGLEMPDKKAIEVKYSKDRPLYTSESLSRQSGNTNYLKKLSRTKFKSWKYEEEVRFVYQLDSLIFESGNYFNYFDDEMILKEVIIGCQATINESHILKVLNGFENITLLWSRMAYKNFRIVKNLQKIYKI